MKVVRAFSLLVIVAAVLSCQAEVPPGLPGNGTGIGGNPPGGPGSGAKQIQVGDNFFSPNSFNAHPGDSITWNWTGSNQHSVTFTTTNPIIDSGVQGTGGKFTYTFAQTGVYSYYCKVHGAAVMTGTITIQ